MNSSPLDTLFVFNTNKDLLGRIKVSGGGYAFKYSKSYLKATDAIAINPIKLPLLDKTYYSIRGFSGDLSAFIDSMPGYWGRAVMDSISNRKLDDLEVLLQNQQDRIGNLIFSTHEKFPDISQSYLKEPLNWGDIIKAKTLFEKTNQFNDKFSELFKCGASQGGARPKISILKGGVHYLAKLPTIRDIANNVQIEHGSLTLAKSVGINVSESEVLNLREGADIFLTKRFDYHEDGKLPYLSMKSVLGADNGSEASYVKFALELKRLNGGLDSIEIFKRMVFNVLISNHDDHYQNHAIYFKGGAWRLTPAFDVVAGEGSGRTQAISIGLSGVQPTYDNILSECALFGIEYDDAKKILDSMIAKIQRDWKVVFQGSGVDIDVVSSVEWAILHGFNQYLS